jgi:hypothetical protein
MSAFVYTATSNSEVSCSAESTSPSNGSRRSIRKVPTSRIDRSSEGVVAQTARAHDFVVEVHRPHLDLELGIGELEGTFDRPERDLLCMLQLRCR